MVRAIQNNAIRQGRNVIYTSADDFTEEFISAIKYHTTNEFKHKYRSVDVLIMEDVHRLDGRHATNNVFLKTLEDLYLRQKQIILTSFKSPSELKGTDRKYISILNWGVVIELPRPDRETSKRLLAHFAQENGVNKYIPDDIYKYMVEKLPKNPRLLQGAINKLTNGIRVYEMDEKEVTYGMIIKELDYIFDRINLITPETILYSVSEYFNIPVETIISRNRDSEVSQARNISMYLSYEYTMWSLDYIAEIHGGRKASSASNAVYRIRHERVTNQHLNNNLICIAEKILK